MTGRAIRITSRIVFVLCGLISLFTAFPYVMFRGVDLPVQSEWIAFVAVLALVGISSLLAGVLPRSWIARILRRDRDDPKIFSQPLKSVGVFAAIAYLFALFSYFAPHAWHLNAQFMFILCPMYFVKMTVDPSPLAIFFVLAPLNAGVYGALGLSAACAAMAFRRAR